jgi:hypothetical protein
VGTACASALNVFSVTKNKISRLGHDCKKITGSPPEEGDPKNPSKMRLEQTKS